MSLVREFQTQASQNPIDKYVFSGGAEFQSEAWLIEARPARISTVAIMSGLIMSGDIITKSNVFISRYTIKPGKMSEFLDIFSPLWHNATEFMKENANFVFYGFGREPNVLVAIESYKNEEAVAAIRQTPEFKDLVSRMLDLCSVPMTMELFNGLELGPEIFNLYPAGKSEVHPETEKNHAIFL